jgi:hypothetical protein
VQHHRLEQVPRRHERGSERDLHQPSALPSHALPHDGSVPRPQHRRGGRWGGGADIGRDATSRRQAESQESRRGSEGKARAAM